MALVVITLLAVVPAAYLVWRVAQPWTDGVAHPATPRADATQLQRDVRELSTRFDSRSVNRPEVLDGAASYIEKRLTEAGLQVVSQRFDARGQTYRNLVVRLGPDTPEVVVVGAHYDVFGELPGADDNASGVAGLIELARLLRTQPLTKRVELVAYTNEEPPFFRTPHMGSAIHAAGLRANDKRVSLMLSLECIGYFSDAPGSQDHPARLMEAIYPTTGNFIALVGFYEDGAVARRAKAAMKGATDLPVHSINAPGFVTGIDFSDHLNYAREGFVGMMVTDTAFYRNKAYHTRADTWERLDYGRMAKVVTGVAAVVLSQANRPM
ncbi:M28 family peptidase [Caenimonas sedimenti]|uniref:M28 family peptidase n=1 Tax=Caenimonas sedimenti TaxID=2596921 RepID=A0A562ZIY3_9BURK|nr:M28 family peptidase [Caenimonas sedimenti]